MKQEVFMGPPVHLVVRLLSFNFSSDPDVERKTDTYRAREQGTVRETYLDCAQELEPEIKPTSRLLQ